MAELSPTEDVLGRCIEVKIPTLRIDNPTVNFAEHLSPR